ncbi:MAG: RluA family pseudouridine synthase [Bacillota bacterium]|jgi:23S rRNA pseudouridine1911/1915/1917 synthase
MTKKNKDNAETKTIIAVEQGKRLDAYLAQELPDLSRSQIKMLLQKGLILVDGQTVKVSREIKGGEEISITIPGQTEVNLEPEKMVLDIIYEDQDLLVINKPQGMVVHPATGHHEKTLVNALLYHCQSLSGVGGALRPGIVHRLDKDTSGLLVVAKNDAAHLGLNRQWKNQEIKRLYHAVLHGVIAEPAGIVEAPLARHRKERIKMSVQKQSGRPAITHYRVLERFSQFTYTQLQLKTGRTHQIRVHMAYLGHPVAGDLLYGPRRSALKLNGQLLHAKELGFRHPISDKWLEFTSQLPPYFKEFIQSQRKK